MGWVPLPLSCLLMIAAGWVHRHQLIAIGMLRAENRVLQDRLRGRRFRFTGGERALLAREAKAAGRNAIWTVVLLLGLGSHTYGQALKSFTPDRPIKIGKMSDKGERALLQDLAAREIVTTGPHYVALEDLDDDGQYEVILLSRSKSLCDRDGCSVLILRKAASGSEILLSQKVAIAKAYALTKEKVNGYRALAVVDANGQIAVGEGSNANQSGKQLVYPMRPSKASETTSAAANHSPSGAAVGSADGAGHSGAPPHTSNATASNTSRSAPPGKASSSTKAGGGATLETVVQFLTSAGKQPDSIDWASINKWPGMKWVDPAPRPLAGEMTRAGYFEFEQLGRSLVAFKGPRAGISSIEVIADVGKYADPSQFTVLLKRHFSNVSTVAQIRGPCKGQLMWGTALYQVTQKDKKPVFVYVVTTTPPNPTVEFEIGRKEQPHWKCTT